MTLTVEAPSTTGAPVPFERPAWFQALVTKRQKGESVTTILWGSPDDYVIRGRPARRYMTDSFVASGIDVVVHYSLDEGITFPAPGMERLYRTTLGLDAPAPSGPDYLGRASQLMSQATGQKVQVAIDNPQAAAFAAIRKASGQPEPGALPSEPDEAIAQIVQFLKLATWRDEEVPSDPKDPTKGSQTVRVPLVKGGARHAAAIIERLDLILPAGDKASMSVSARRLIGRLHRASNDRELLGSQNPLICLTPTLEDVAEDVRRSSWRAIEIPLPDYGRRLAFVQELQDTCLHCGQRSAVHEGGVLAEPHEFTPEVELDMDAEELAVSTASLGLVAIEDIAMLARGGRLTRPMALARQRELLDAEYGEGLAPMDPSFGYEALGGIDHLVGMFRQWVIPPLRSADPRKKRYCPKGALLVGPPGTGKSVFCRATAHEAGVAAVELRLTKSKWYGESSRNLAKQIRGIRAYGRVLVFVDEYDKFLGSSEGAGDSSTDAELRKLWQEFTADPSIRGEVFFLAATNYPENVLPALMRKGRIDWIAPMLAPATPEERAEILVRQLQANGYDLDVDDPKIQAVITDDLTGDWTGSDLEAAVVKACGAVAIQSAALGAALQNAVYTLIPSDPLAVQRMTRSALRYCSDLALLPPSRRPEAVTVKQEPEPTVSSDPGRRIVKGGLEL